MKKSELLSKLSNSEELTQIAFVPVSKVIEWVEELEENSISDEALSELAYQIASDLCNEGDGIVDDYELDISNSYVGKHTIEANNFSFDKEAIESCVQNTINGWVKNKELSE